MLQKKIVLQRDNFAENDAEYAVFRLGHFWASEAFSRGGLCTFGDDIRAFGR